MIFKRRRTVLVINPNVVSPNIIKMFATLPIVSDYSANPGIQVKRI